MGNSDHGTTYTYTAETPKQLTLTRVVQAQRAYNRANSYPWSPFFPRQTRPGPGPHTFPTEYMMMFRPLLMISVGCEALARYSRASR